MGFRDNDDAGNSVRIEGMENNVHDSRVRMLRGVDHNGLDFVNIV
jgi:hypothetical protein